MAFNFGSNTPGSSGAVGGSLFGTAGSNNNQQQNKSLFGGASTPSAGGGLFGAGSTTPSTSGGGLFGNAAASASQQSSAFGGGSTTPQPASGGLFGAKPAAPGGEQPKSLFGASTASSQPSNGGIFAGGAPAAGGGEQKTGGTLFGNAQSGTSTPSSGGFSFGQKKEEPKPAQTMAGGSSLFGGAPASTSQSSTPNNTTPAAGGGLFGNNSSTAGGSSLFSQNKPASSSSLFGGAQTPAGGAAAQQGKPLSGNMFGMGGNGTTTPGATTGSSFFPGMGSKDASKDSNSTTPQGNKTAPTPSFTPAGNPPTGNMFGAGAAASKPAPSLFTQAPKADETKAPATGGGEAQTKPAAPFGFGKFKTTVESAPNSAISSAPGSVSLFGGQKVEAAKEAQPTTEKHAETPKPSATFSGAFGKKPETTATGSTPAATSNLFGGAGAATGNTFGKKPEATLTGSKPAATPSMFGAAALSSSQPGTATTAPGTTAGSSLFGSGAPSATKSGEAASSEKPAATSMFGNTTTQQPSTQPTSQPAQLAQPASRLAGKSLDEILTSWSTSLATHQSRFAKLATQVGNWDRELTTNSTSISKLYSRCFQAERDVAEVERQLSTVEQGQRELEARLDKYEADVDGLLEQAGLSDAGGVDRERESTYRTAEACSDRLMEMNQSLTAMIEGINDASAKLSSSSAASGKAAKDASEDPLSQIVRVLNSHLAQLQVIDSGAAELSKRVESAQVDAGVAGSRLGGSMRGSMMGGGGSSEVAEGFKKSFFRS
jgi:nuclear pore complex protein Nup62